MGGARPATFKRYRAILDKFLVFSANEGIHFWQNVTANLVRAYGKHLEEADYAYATQFIELATLNQVVKFLTTEAKLIPPGVYVPVKLKKPDAVTRYCYTPDQVGTIVHWCSQGGGPRWLGPVLIALATTGMRIEELASLRWSDIDLTAKTITLPDNSRRGTQATCQDARTTKGG
jgi:site-specific recombinase XerD